MADSDSKSRPSIGFLTVREYDELGLIGGYLLLNPAGRPLEFHCTAPVRPNRAQEILYGPTLKPFLYGEQIGRTLLAKSKHQPQFVCTDLEEVLALRQCVSVPVVFLRESKATEPAGEAAPRKWRIDAGTPLPNELHFRWGQYQAQVGAESDRQTLTKSQQADAEFDLLEPFQRLAEAIDETQGGVTRT